MIVISDSNILFSALITPNGTIHSIIKAKKKVKIIAPTYLLDELYEHFDDLLINTPFHTRSELNTQIKILKNLIEFVDIENISINNRQKAYYLVKDIDLDDLFFVALALHKNCKLWTTDSVLAKWVTEKRFYKNHYNFRAKKLFVPKVILAQANSFNNSNYTGNATHNN